VTWFERRRFHRLFGTAITYVVVLAIVVGLSWLVLPILARQTADLIQRLPDMAVTVQDVVNRQLARLGIAQRIVLDPDNADVGQAINDFFRDNRDQLLGLLRGAGSIVASVIALLVTLILAPVLAFYVLADLPRLSDGVRRLVPPDSRSEFVDVSQRILTTVGAYFRGQLLVALFVGVATAAGLGIIGLPFWAIVGATAGVFNLVPFIGPFVGGAIGVVVALTVGSGLSQAIVVVIVMTAGAAGRQPRRHAQHPVADRPRPPGDDHPRARGRREPVRHPRDARRDPDRGGGEARDHVRAGDPVPVDGAPRGGGSGHHRRRARGGSARDEPGVDGQGAPQGLGGPAPPAAGSEDHRPPER
jgi:hypothetical protein